MGQGCVWGAQHWVAGPARAGHTAPGLRAMGDGVRLAAGDSRASVPAGHRMGSWCRQRDIGVTIPLVRTPSDTCWPPYMLTGWSFTWQGAERAESVKHITICFGHGPVVGTKPYMI